MGKKYKRCKWCSAHLQKRTKMLTAADIETFQQPLRQPVSVGDILCSACLSSVTDNGRQPFEDITSDATLGGTPNTASPSNESPASKKIKLELPKASSKSSNCIICGPRRTDSRPFYLKRLKPEARAKIFSKTGIFVPAQARACVKHFDGDNLHSECYGKIQIESHNFDASDKDITDLLSSMRKMTESSNKLDFHSEDSLSDSDYLRLTGIDKSQFETMHSCLTSVYSTEVRSSRTALALLLVKLRTGLSLPVLSTLFGIKKRACGKAIHSARQALMTDFVPQHLGFEHVSRAEIIENHTSAFARVIFGDDRDDVAVCVADGTYIYIEKSSNYSFQRRSYSVHKGRPLVKPMMIVASDGYIISVLGPYLADGRNNDAKITEHMFKSNTENIQDWFEEGDVLVVDRGFRDVADLLEECGIKTHMPHFIGKSQKALSTEEANETRLVTKVRWVVESANGRIKQWKALSNVMPNSQIPYIGDYVRIICATCNAFKPPLFQTSEEDDIVAKRMLALSKLPNQLKQQVEANGWDTRVKTQWKVIDEADLTDFPQLTESELRDKTMGVYQLKQADSYTEEHTTDSGQYIIMVHKETAGILKANIRSRHTSAGSYNLWIEYGPGLDPIKGWFCKCKSGSRIVGCCAHIASVMWFLGFYRHQQNESKTPQLKSHYFSYLTDAANKDWDTSSSESDDSESENVWVWYM